MSRLTWEMYALMLADTAAMRSEDPYVRVGAAILAEDHSVLATGYNGAPSGVDIDWSDRDQRRLRVIHAEANALRYVLPGEGVLLASTLMPCLECLKMARAQGIMKIVYSDDSLSEAYDREFIKEVAEEFGVEMERL